MCSPCFLVDKAQHEGSLLSASGPSSCPPLLQAGLRGINLSGGQRQRLNLARCAYYNGDLVLLDNALSAVVHHTAQHIFQHCVRGMFRDKATVLVTHQVTHVPAVAAAFAVLVGGAGMP